MRDRCAAIGYHGLLRGGARIPYSTLISDSLCVRTHVSDPPRDGNHGGGTADLRGGRWVTVMTGQQNVTVILAEAPGTPVSIFLPVMSAVSDSAGGHSGVLSSFAGEGWFILIMVHLFWQRKTTILYS